MTKYFLISLILLMSVANSYGSVDSLAKAGSTVVNDIKDISKMEFGQTSPLYQKIFQGSDSDAAARFFNSRVKGISWVKDAGLGVMASNYFGNMSLGPAIFFDDVAQVERMSILIHEARHSESAYNFHSRCKASFEVFSKVLESGLLNARACDETELGAIGAQYAFLRAIVESCKNCSAQMKNDARLFSQIQVFPRINDKHAAERLLSEGNLNPAEAFEEFQIVTSNWYKSKIDFNIWKKNCRSKNSCFKRQ